MHLREWTDDPGTRLDVVERKWAMTRPDGVTHFFDSLGYLRETEDRNGNTLKYNYRYFDTVSGQADDPDDLTDGNVCATKPVGELTEGVLCIMRLVSVDDPAGVQAEPGQPGGAPNRTLTIDYVDGGLLAVGDGGGLVDPPLESPIPFPGLVGGKAGRIETITDHAGDETRFAYDEDGLLVTLTEAANRPDDKRVTRFEWEAKEEGTIDQPGDDPDDGLGQDRQLTAVVEANRDGSERARTRLAYHPHTCETPDGAVLCDLIPGVLRDPRPLKTLTNRRGFAKQFAYPSGDEGRRTMEVMAEVESDADGQPVEEQRTVHEVDERGRPVTITDALGQETVLEWTTDNRVERLVEASGSADEAVTAMEYNANGLLTEKTTWPDGQDGVERAVKLTYDDTSGVYHPGGQDQEPGGFVSDLEAIENPKPGTGWEFGLDDRGNVTSKTDARGNTVTMGYDELGRMTSQTDELGRTTTFADFDPSGAPGTVIEPENTTGRDPSMRTWRYCYDRVGNVTRVTDPRGAVIDCSSPGNHAFSVRLAYDSFDRLTHEWLPKDSAAPQPKFIDRSKVYDRNGNVTSATDGQDETTEVEYTAMDMPRVVRTPSDNGTETTFYGYDGLDRLIRRTDPKGEPPASVTDAGAARHTTTFRLDPVGQRVAEVRHAPGQTPDRLIASYDFDQRGNVVGIVDPRRNAGETVAQAVADAADPANRRVTRTYNDVNELVAEVESPTEAGLEQVRTEFRYDPNGNRIAVVTPRGFTEGPEGKYTASFEFDHRDQLVAVEQPTGTVDGEARFSRTEYVRRCDGRVLAVASPRAASAPEGERAAATDQVPGCGAGSGPVDVHRYFTTRYSYDAQGGLRSRSVPFAPDQYGRSDSELAGWRVTYTRDAVGNPEVIEDARGNSFNNNFFDTGEIRSTERPSWWRAEWGSARHVTPDPGQRYVAGEGVDTQVAVGGPVLAENAGRSSNAQASGEEPDLPDSQGYGNFAKVDTQPLPGLLPKAGQTSFGYDNEMRLTTVTHTEGSKSVLEYGPAGRVLSKHWAFKPDNPIVHAFGYDRHGNLTAFTDGEGTETTFAYDGFDRRISETAPGALGSLEDARIDAEVTRLTYDPNGNLTGRVAPRGTVTPEPGDYAFEYGYDSLDRLTSEANPEDERWTYAHDVADNRVSETSPRGNAGEQPPAGESFSTGFVFDAAQRLTRRTDGLDHPTTYSYDLDSNLTRVEAPGAKTGAGGSLAPRITSTTYDGRGLPWQETTGAALAMRTRVKEFDPNGNLRRVVNPKGVAGPVPEHTDSGSDAEADLKDPTYHATVRTYDEDDLLTDVYLPWGARDARDRRRFVQSFVRDSRGRVESIVSAHELGAENAPRVSYGRFETGWISHASDEDMVDPDSGQRVKTHEVDYDYNRRGDQILWDSKSAGETPRGRRITRDFYPNGTLESRTAFKVIPGEEGSEETRRSYRYFYNPNRSLSELQDRWEGRPEGQAERVTRFGRDGAERETLVNETWASGKDTVMVYDRAGNVKTRKTDGRLVDGVYVDSNGGRDDAKTTGFEYDVLDRETLMSVSQGDGGVERTIERSYHPSGELESKRKHTTAQAADRDILEERFYTVHGELAEFTRKRDGASGFIKESAYSYDENGNRTRDERGTHEFNAQDRLVQWTRSSKQPNPGTMVAYELDGTGAIQTKTDGALPAGEQATTYSYNGTRLTETEDAQATSEFSYDDFGNVIRIEQTLKEDNTVFPPVGELPTLPETCGDLDDLDAGTTVYCFDEFERMVAAKGPGLDEDPAVYEYDGLDRRDVKITKNLAGDKRRDYSYVGTTRLLSREQDTEGKTRYYDYSSAGRREGQSVAPSDQAAPTVHRTYGTDANGSVQDLAEEDGTVAPDNRYRYDPYGQIATDVTDPSAEPEDELGPAAEDNPFRYQGHYYDTAIKTYDMQARQYRPDLQRFLTQDRYESAAGDLNLQTDPLTQNRYAFAGGNPVNLVEFDGHEPAEGSFKNNPDRDNPYGGRANTNINDDYNFVDTGNGTWSITTTASDGTLTTRTEPIPQAPPPPTQVAPARPVTMMGYEPGLNDGSPIEATRLDDQGNPIIPTPEYDRSFGESLALTFELGKAVLLPDFSDPISALGSLPPLKILRAGRVAKVVEKADDLAAKGGAGPVRAGQAGEAAAGITKNTQRIPSATGAPGSYRVPDVYDPRTGVLGEIKNVGYQPYSSQLRDYAAIAQREGLAFELTVRHGTRLSGPLQQAEALGQVRVLRGLP